MFKRFMIVCWTLFFASVVALGSLAATSKYIQQRAIDGFCDAQDAIMIMGRPSALDAPEDLDELASKVVAMTGTARSIASNACRRWNGNVEALLARLTDQRDDFEKLNQVWSVVLAQVEPPHSDDGTPVDLAEYPLSDLLTDLAHEQFRKERLTSYFCCAWVNYPTFQQMYRIVGEALADGESLSRISARVDKFMWLSFIVWCGLFSICVALHIGRWIWKGREVGNE